MDQTQQSEGSLGPIIGTIIILVVIILGGLYFWSERTKTAAPSQTTANSQAGDIQAVQQQSSSDDLGSIQTDLNATNVSGVDAALQSQ